MQGGDGVIHLARIYCYKGAEFRLVEVPVPEARHKRREMRKEGFVVVHSEVV